MHLFLSDLHQICRFHLQVNSEDQCLLQHVEGNCQSTCIVTDFFVLTVLSRLTPSFLPIFVKFETGTPY